jgi:hypothetical protein
MIRVHCAESGAPPGCGGGLLIWHIDSVKSQGGGVNAGFPHGVALQQADGLAQLDRSVDGNRGDGGDPFPGVTSNRAFSVGTNPEPTRNTGGFAGLAVDSIRQLVPNGEMAFRVRFGGVTLVRASDTAAVVMVGADTHHVFRDLVDNGASLTIAVPDTQLAADGGTRWRFSAWSDGQPRVHDIIGSAAGDTVVAELARDFRVAVVVGAHGAVTPAPAVDLSGTLVAEGTPVSLTAAAAPGYVFGAWTGDTVASDPILVLPMTRPYRVTARFDSLLAIVSTATRPNGVMGATYDDALETSGGAPSFTWSVVGGALPPGLALGATSGRITGIPTATGTYPFTLRVASGPQAVSLACNLTIVAPTLATAAVVSHLVNGGSTLTADALRYLDLIGNRNGQFDVGDFLAWVNVTGAPLTGVAAALAVGARR